MHWPGSLNTATEVPVSQCNTTCNCNCYVCKPVFKPCQLWLSCQTRPTLPHPALAVGCINTYTALCMLNNSQWRSKLFLLLNNTKGRSQQAIIYYSIVCCDHNNYLCICVMICINIKSTVPAFSFLSFPCSCHLCASEWDQNHRVPTPTRIGLITYAPTT